MVTQILVDLFGEVALLMWGIHMVHTGVLRAFGSRLRQVLSHGLHTPIHAFLSGLGITTLMQSSTATALMVSSFAAGGVLELAPSLAMMLGANVGTTLVVQALSFDITLLFPLLILIGVTAFRRSARTRTRDLGRAAIGLGLMLLALHLILQTVQPIEASRTLRLLLSGITSDPTLNLLLAALFTLVAHSSVASMLFIMSLAGAGVLSPVVTLAMVLGANLGSALNPVLESSRDDPAKLRMPVGNLINRVVGCVLALPLLGWIEPAILRFDPDPGRLAAHFHLLFNLVMSLLFLGILPRLAEWLTRWLPEQDGTTDPSKPQYLDAALLSSPSLALTNAAREVLRMADVVTGMLRHSLVAFRDEDRDKINEVRRMDDTLDSLHHEIQQYLAALSTQKLEEQELRRVGELLNFAANLEHVGDIVDRNLMGLASKRIKQKLVLEEEELAEIDEVHSRLLDHLQLAVSVLMFGDANAARRLLNEKVQMRTLELSAAERQLAQMREGLTAKLASGTLHLDTLRVLKRMDAHLAGTAYPVLEQLGEIRPSRLASS